MIFIHFLGTVNVEHQKLDMPAMTVLMSSSLPAKKSDFAVQLLILFFTCWISGSQLTKDSFFVQSGTPRLRMGKETRFGNADR